MGVFYLPCSRGLSKMGSFTKAFLLLAVISAVSCLAETRERRTASPSPHSTYSWGYSSYPYTYSYYPYYSLLYGRKKRSAAPEPHGYGYWGRKKRSAAPEPYAHGYYGYGYRSYYRPYHG